MDKNSFYNSSKKKNKEIYKVEEIKFPQGTKYKKELNLNFKYFNILWYDPNKVNEFENFKKCFENVHFYKINDLESTLKFFEKESSFEWIVIAPGSKREELINILEENQFIKAFFVYCTNIHVHKKWAKRKKKVECLASSSKILCQKLIELNKQYLIPNFKYSNEAKESDFLFNLKELKSENK